MRVKTLIVGLVMCTGVLHANVDKGVCDASSHDFEKAPLRLNGTWQFLCIDSGSPLQWDVDAVYSYVQVPGSWTGSTDCPLLSRAIYKCKILMPGEKNHVSMHIPVVNAACKIWINNELYAEVGTVEELDNGYMARLKGIVVQLPDTSSIDITIEVANYTYFSSGVVSLPLIDRTVNVFETINKSSGIENFLVGSLVAMFIFQIILFILYRRAKPNFWLAILCLIIGVRSMIVNGGSFLLPELFPMVPVETWKKIEFVGVYWIGAILSKYVYHQLAPLVSERPQKIFTAVSIILTVIVLVSPQYVYGKLLEVGHVTILAAAVHFGYSVYTARLQGNKDSGIILWGFFTSMPFVILEVLKNTKLLSLNLDRAFTWHAIFRHMAEIGLLIFLLFQIYLLVRHYSGATIELESAYADLEERIKKRTSELLKSNGIKERLLSVISHDIKSPLAALHGVLRLFNSNALTSGEVTGLVSQLEERLLKTNLLVENILYWTSSQMGGFNTRAEQFNMLLLIEENIGLLSHIAERKGVKLNHTIRSFVIEYDRQILNLVIRNLISNAIKYTDRNGTISIDCFRTNSKMEILVTDNGVGMDKDFVRNLMATDQNISKSGTLNETGTGLGLSLCKEFLTQAGGELSVRSKLGSGSTFTVSIPIAKAVQRKEIAL